MSKSKSDQSVNNTYRRTWHQSLVDYFAFIKNKEDKIDSIRSALHSQKNFNPKMLFQYIDNQNKNKITLNDLISFLNENSTNFKEENLRRFIHNFDKDNDFCLNYKEFMGIILPLKDKAQLLQNNFLSEIQSDINYKDIGLDEIVKKIFCSLLAEEMDLIIGCNKIIREILGYNGFTPYEAFLDIVNSNERYINENNLQYFLTKNNIEIKEEEIHQLMFRLDMDNDGKISYEEFQNMFLPLNKNTLTTIQSDNSMNNNIKKEFDDINLNLNNNFNNYNISQQKNSNISNSNYSINKYSNTFFGEDISPIRKESSNAQSQTKREINNINIDINSERNFKSNSNILFDSLEECSKNQESINATKKNNFNSIFINNNDTNKYKFKNKVNILNKGFKKCHHHNCFRDNKNKKIDIDIYENIDNKIKKIFQIPKDKIFHRSLTKREEENKERENNSKSPKISYTKVPLNFDYSNYSNDIDKILLIKKTEIPKRNNSVRNISKCMNLINQETNIIINDNNNNKNSNSINNNNKNDNNQLSINNDMKETPNQKHFIRLKKKHNIPFSASRNKSTDLLIKNNYHSYRQKSSLYNNSLNKNSNETTYSSKKNITNNLYKNTFITYQNNTINKENNKNNDNENDINQQNKLDNSGNLQEVQINEKNNNIKKPFNLQNLILNSPIQEKKDDDSININDNIQNFEKKLLIVKKKIAEIKEQQILYNQKFSGSQNKNRSKNLNENNDMTDVRQNNKPLNANKHFATEIKTNEIYDFNNYELLPSGLNKPSQTNNENKDINLDKKDYNFIYSTRNILKNSTSSNNANSSRMNNINRIDVNNNYTKYVIKNNNCINKMDVGDGKNKINYNLYNKNRINNNNNKLMIDTYEGNQMSIIKKSEPFSSQVYYPISNEKIDTETLTIFQEVNSEKIQNERFNNLYNLLYDFLKWELIIENIKQSLCTQEDINTNFIFEIFDTKKRNLISISDIVKALEFLGMKFNVEDIKFIFLKNNKRIKDKYKYNEFCELILPNNAEKRNEMNQRVLNLNYMNELSDKTKNLICLLFQKIIEGERSNEIYRNMLAIVPNSSGFDLFNLMKKNYAAGICKKDIETFLSSRGKVYNNNEVDLIMKKLDKNQDGIVDYTEFLTEITPKVIF